jgi:hypothetical protein
MNIKMSKQIGKTEKLIVRKIYVRLPIDGGHII